LRAEGSYDQAISDITRAIELFKSSASSGIVASAYVTRGSFYALSGDKEKALDDYKHALVLDAANPQAAEGVAQTEAAIKAASIPSGPAPERPSTLAPVHGGKEVQTEHKKVPTEEIPGRDTLVQECLAAYVRVHGAFRAEGQSDATYKSRSDMTSMCNSAISQGNYYWRVYKTTRSANPARQLSCCRANLHSRGMTGDVSSECKRLSEVDWCKLQQQY
jgi:tetratricopeptide (TPR) repeat protein